MKMLLLMPTELQEQIFLLCSAKDLKALSCCSRSSSEAVKQYLWQVISVPSKDLFDEDLNKSNRIDLFQHISVLCVGVHPSGEVNEGLNDCIRPSYLKNSSKVIKSKEKKRLNNFSFILKHCRAKVLHTSFMHVSVDVSKFPALLGVIELHLYWSAVTDAIVRSICDNCCQLQIFSLHGGCLTDKGLSYFAKLNKLLKLSIRNSTQITDPGLAVFGSMHNLRDLTLIGCSGLTRALFNHLCLLKSLERFTVSGFGIFITKGELSKLSGLLALKEINTKFSTEIADEDLMELCKLKHLEKLCLNHCVQVTDDALTNIRCLHNLQHLELCLSSRTDVLVALLGSHLRTLVVNRGYGMTDISLSCISELVSLRRLSLAHCDSITDTGVASLVNLVNLIDLELTYCGEGISDTGFSSLQHMKKLRRLVIQGHSINSSLEQIGKILTLEVLVVHNSSVTSDVGLKHIQNLIQLEKVSIVDCDKVTDTGLSYICSMNSLKELTFSNSWPGSSTNITDFALASLPSLFHLRKLDLCNCKFITDTSLSIIGKIKGLKHLNMRSCFKITDNGLKQLKNLEQVERLNVSACSNITDIGLSWIACLITLRSLDISLCHSVTDHGLKYLCSLIYLQTLDCSYCEQITDAGLESIGLMCTLKELRMHNCSELSNAGLNHLRHLFHLEKLNVVDCYGISGLGLHRYLRSPHAGINQLKHVPFIHY